MQVTHSPGRVEIFTPAKINLYLEVLGRREDGFHEIETVMAPISLWDRLTLESREDAGLAAQCTWAPGTAKARRQDATAGLPQDRENIAVRAIELLRERYPAAGGAQLTIIKRIPAAAGLGGGSSDGAAALVAGNLLWNLNLSGGELGALAAELGSDVPFFLSGGAAVCRGRGERIEPIAMAGCLDLIVTRPPEGLSTAAVYQECRASQLTEVRRPSGCAALISGLQTGDRRQIAASLLNRLEAPAARLSPWIARVREAVLAQGCWAAQMSGSGTSYFGLCHSGAHARRAASRLRALGYATTFAVHSGES